MGGRLALVAVLLLVLFSATTSPVSARPEAVGCSPQIKMLVKSLTVIEGHLDAGVSFSQYSAYVAKAYVAYDAVPAHSLSVACVNDVGIPAQRALNYYTRAKNAWAECVRSTTTRHCTSAGDLNYAAEQTDWADAKANIERAIDNLG